MMKLPTVALNSSTDFPTQTAWEVEAGGGVWQYTVGDSRFAAGLQQVCSVAGGSQNPLAASGEIHEPAA